ncbi:MAG: chromosomal replication initiator protein DnaA [Candidatus Margulisbacteria bacterium]|nr:chromosomal replication initiator protein DnaA [Candidatus Margulisiibacteriota bacterium]
MIASVDLNLLWNKVMPALEKSVNRPVFETLLSSTKPFSLQDGLFEIAVPNVLVKDWLSQHCLTLLEQEIKSLSPEIQKVIFVLGPPDLFNTPNIDILGGKQFVKLEKATSSNPTLLNPRYIFETFVVGQGNRFAHAASLAVAEAPAKAYNPLFLYGGVGLGKTHLMQAIGNHVALHKHRAKVLYITSETFTNELINSIRDDKAISFRNKYRNIDVLMVDDIQFLAGKERTQEEFFHTFNTLYEAGKQIVLSSDRPPKEIPTLEERLRSRFEWGLTADIQSPDFETRIAILKKKAEISELIVSDDLLAHIASRIESNIRELEGALIRVMAYASLSNVEITTALVDFVLKDLFSPKKNGTGISIDSIKKATADYYSIRIDDMSAKIRTKEIAEARQLAMYLARELTGLSLPKIGDGFGGRDHTTVMHACEKMKSALKSDPAIQEAVKKINTKLVSYAH